MLPGTFDEKIKRSALALSALCTCLSKLTQFVSGAAACSPPINGGCRLTVRNWSATSSEAARESEVTVDHESHFGGAQKSEESRRELLAGRRSKASVLQCLPNRRKHLNSRRNDQHDNIERLRGGAGGCSPREHEGALGPQRAVLVVIQTRAY